MGSDIDTASAPDSPEHVGHLIDHLANLRDDQTETVRKALNDWHLKAIESPRRVGSLDAFFWKLEGAIGMADALTIVTTIECARRLYEEVEMGESVGTCLADRVPSLQLGTQLALFDFDFSDDDSDANLTG